MLLAEQISLRVRAVAVEGEPPAVRRVSISARTPSVGDDVAGRVKLASAARLRNGTLVSPAPGAILVVMKTRFGLSALAIALLALACTHIKESDKAHEEAATKGKYAVQITENVEKVEGTCKFVKNIEPQYDPVQIPAPSQLSDYYRTHAVLAGADTVLVRGQGKVGEAYICGPGPLNPDGTRRDGPLPPSGPSTPPPG